MKKILLIHASNRVGGGTISFLDIVDMLGEDYEVTVCIPGGKSPISDSLHERGVLVEYAPFSFPLFPYYSGGPMLFSRTFWCGLFNCRFLGQWSEFIRELNPDVVLVNSSILAPMGLAIRKARVKAICFNRETFIEGRVRLLTRVMLWMLNHWFEAVLFISKYDLKYANLPNPLSEVVADCLAKTQIQPEKKAVACKKIGINAKSFNILYVGGVQKIKGLDVLLRALKELDDPNIRVVLAGDMSMSSKDERLIVHYWRLIRSGHYRYMMRVRALIQDKHISPKIKLIGIQNCMNNIFSASDVLLFPSVNPHQARPAFEAGWYSLPVIISDFPQTSEFVKDGYNGITFAPNSAVDLVDKIRYLFKHADIRKDLGLKNLECTKKLHNFDIEKAKLLEVIAEL